MLNLMKRLAAPAALAAFWGYSSLPAADLPARATQPKSRQSVKPVKFDIEDPVPDADSSLLQDQRKAIQLMTEKMRNQVSNVISDSRQMESEFALASLKQVLGSVKSAIDLDPEDRLRMQKQLETAIQQKENLQETQHQERVRSLERRAQEEARARLSEQSMLDEERLENLIDRVRSLMLEGRHGRDDAYAEAQEVADVAVNMRPGEGSSTAARFAAEGAHQLTRAFRLRERRADQFLEMLHQTELSHIPFPDEPPLRFPPAAVWKALSERRRQTATVDLKKSSPNEKRIQKALSETTEVSFTDNPLEEALNYLEDLHKIEIWLDKAALSDEGINTDQQISLIMTGISLRSVLRLMLEPLGLTYIIEDEVMKITTQAVADDKMSTRVYPVADLVIPIMPPMGGMMGGMGGGMGGGGMFSVPPAKH
jgi:hypothetical protein